jgi:SNF2 family DNA or RNA helicase
MSERLWILDIPFDKRGATGSKWDSELRASVYRGNILPTELEDYKSQPYSWQRYLEESQGVRYPAIPSKNTFRLRPHQIEAQMAIIKAYYSGAKGFLLADDVGVGKTISAWSAVQAISSIKPIKNVLVITPLAVTPHWRRTIADLGDLNLNIVVINYDRLKNLVEVPEQAKSAKRKSTKNKRTAKHGVSIVDWDIVIADESHKCRHAESQRSQLLANISQYRKEDNPGPFTIWLSATAGQNPTELSYLSPILGQVGDKAILSPKGFGAWLEAEGFHVKEGSYGKWSWSEDSYEREKDIAKLRSFIFDCKTPLALRRLPTDIAGWPEISRFLLPIELELEEERLYNEAWTQFRKEMQLARRGKDPKAGLVARLRFRQKSSLIRAHGTTLQALELLDNGHQVAISCAFLESLDSLYQDFTNAGILVAVMDGRNVGERENERLKFQTGKAKVILFTTVEGFSLHSNELLSDQTSATSAPRSLIIHDARYSGIEAIQIEGRTHRDGQDANVFYTFASDTVEEDIIKTLLSNVESTKSLVGDDTSLIKALEAMLEGVASNID